MVAFLCQFFGAIYSLRTAAIIIAYLFSTCLALEALIKDLSNDLQEMNLRLTSDGSNRNEKKSFCDIIELYINVRQLSKFPQLLGKVFR